jgi:putative phosphoribosyl transferase
MIFENRKHAGKLLGEALKKYEHDPNVIVIGLPRGGVVVAYEVARILGVPLDIVSPRKIGAPFNPELALGAITETGGGVFDEQLIAYLGVSKDQITKTIEQEKVTAQKRLKLYRKNKPPRNLMGKIVIIVDDGLATGSTMKAAIQSIKAENADRIIVAIPVSPIDTLKEIKNLVDEVVCLSSPSLFHAVGQFYREFDQTSDEEVIALLNQN